MTFRAEGARRARRAPRGIVERVPAIVCLGVSTCESVRECSVLAQTAPQDPETHISSQLRARRAARSIVGRISGIV